MEEEKIGIVVKYFAEPQVVAISLEKELSVGDKIHIKGHTTDFEQTITSMQIENQSVQKAKPGEDVGVKVDQRARPNDDVYRAVQD